MSCVRPSLFCFHIFPANTEGRSSIFREAVCCPRGGMSASHALKSDATSLASPSAFVSYCTERGTGNAPGTFRTSEVWLHIMTWHITPHPKGFPTVLSWLQALGKRLPLLPSTSPCQEALTSSVHPNALELCGDEERAEDARFQSCLPEEHLEDFFGRFCLQISFQVITDLAVGHLANPQRTQIKTPRSPAP